MRLAGPISILRNFRTRKKEAGWTRTDEDVQLHTTSAARWFAPKRAHARRSVCARDYAKPKPRRPARRTTLKAHRASAGHLGSAAGWVLTLTSGSQLADTWISILDSEFTVQSRTRDARHHAPWPMPAATRTEIPSEPTKDEMTQPPGVVKRIRFTVV